MLHAYQPFVIRSETPSFWRLKSLSFDGHVDRKILVSFWESSEERFFLFHFDNLFLRWRWCTTMETSLKRALNIILARTVVFCHILIMIKHISKLNCTVLIVPVDGGLVT